MLKQKNLRCQMVALALEGHIPFTEIKTVTEFLDCYNYVVPSDRTLCFDMLAYLTKGTIESGSKASHVFKAWLLADMVEGMLTEKEQHLVLNIIEKRNLYARSKKDGCQ